MLAGNPGAQRRIKMNVVLYGATGNSGQRILKELTNRRHHVTAVARDTSKIPSTVKAVKDDLSSVEAIASIIAGADVVVSAYAPPRDNTDALLGVTGRQIAAGCSSERMTYGNYQQISFGRNAQAKPAFCLFAAGSIPEHPTHSLGAVEHCRQIAAPIRHHPAAVQRSSHSAGSWD